MTLLLHIHTHPFISTSGLYPPLVCVSDNCTVTRFVRLRSTQRKWSNCIKRSKTHHRADGNFRICRIIRLLRQEIPSRSRLDRDSSYLASLTWSHSSTHSFPTNGNDFPITIILRTVAAPYFLSCHFFPVWYMP